MGGVLDGVHDVVSRICIFLLVSVFWCVEMDFFSLKCNGVPSDEFCNGSMC